MLVVGWSGRLAMNIPARCIPARRAARNEICHRSSRPGDENKIFIASGCPPLRVPFVHDGDARVDRMHQHFRIRDRLPVMRHHERSAAPSALFGHISSNSLFQVMSRDARRGFAEADDAAD